MGLIEKRPNMSHLENAGVLYFYNNIFYHANKKIPYTRQQPVVTFSLCQQKNNNISLTLLTTT